MSENIKRLNEVTKIVQTHIESMMNEIWETSNEKTRELGSAITQAEEDLTKIILNELVTIDACD